MQLLIVDPAFYKSEVQLQKYMKGGHGMGLKIDLNVTYKGRKVFDSPNERVMILEDRMVESTSLDEISNYFLNENKAGRLSDQDTATILSTYGYSNYKLKNGQECAKVGDAIAYTQKINITPDFVTFSRH